MRLREEDVDVPTFVVTRIKSVSRNTTKSKYHISKKEQQRGHTTAGATKREWFGRMHQIAEGSFSWIAQLMAAGR